MTYGSGITSIFRNVALRLHLASYTDRELMVSAVKSLQLQLLKENNFGSTRNKKSNAPNLIKPVEFDMTITEDCHDQLTGYITITNRTFETSDEIDFKISVHKRKEGNYSPQYDFSNSPEQYDGPSRYVEFSMPHWSFPQFITTKYHRLALISFLKNEAIDRIGLESSLKLKGLV